MSAEASVFSRSWKVGRWTATLTMPTPRPGGVMAVAIEWSPELPHRLSTDEVAQYRAGRAAAVAELSALIGGRIAVVEAR